MRKSILILVFAIHATAGFAKKKTTTVGDSSRFVIEVSGLAGALTERISNSGKAGIYSNAALYKVDNMTFTNGSMVGGDVQFAYFFGKKKTFGVGIGYMYAAQKGNIALDSFRADYRATDSRGATFRQVVNGHSVKEELNIKSFNVPVVAKYKLDISPKFSFAVDAGLLINLQEAISYSTDANASFNYEAIYKFTSGNPMVAVYDDAETPDVRDWFITTEYYSRSHTSNSTQLYFDTLRRTGYNVALNVHPGNKSGEVSYKAGSIGFLLRPSVAYKIADNFAITLGGFISAQKIRNKPSSDYSIISIDGYYSSPLNSVSAINKMTYGVSLGLKYSFGD